MVAIPRTIAASAAAGAGEGRRGLTERIQWRTVAAQTLDLDRAIRLKAHPFRTIVQSDLSLLEHCKVLKESKSDKRDLTCRRCDSWKADASDIATDDRQFSGAIRWISRQDLARDFDDSYFALPEKERYAGAQEGTGRGRMGAIHRLPFFAFFRLRAFRALLSSRLISVLLRHQSDAREMPSRPATLMKTHRVPTRDMIFESFSFSVPARSAILTMAERLNVETLAEGVETVGEHALLAQLGCNHVQGFGIGKPMPFDQTLSWIAAHNAKLADAPAILQSRAK